VIERTGILTVRPVGGLTGSYRPPGDKSISHRALIIGALAQGETRIAGIAPGRDVADTSCCLQKLGVDINSQPEEDTTTVIGLGARGLQATAEILDCGNSGTTARLLAGVIAGQGVRATMTGDISLSRRPMRRIADPLRAMGANVELTPDGTMPVQIGPGRLRGISWHSPVASAQVKSAILLAGLNADGPTEVTEPVRSRDHTERMLSDFGADVETGSTVGREGPYTVRIDAGCQLTARDISIPADISSAIYLVVAAVLTQRSDLTLIDIGLNPGRREALDVLIRMGADIEIVDERIAGSEPVGTLRVRSSCLTGAVVSGASTTWLIDEVPALAAAAAFAEGETRFSNVLELRWKESDRISAIISNLRKMRVDVCEQDDGFTIQGGPERPGARFDSFDDHRIALAFHAAALACRGESTIHGYGAAGISWPDLPEVISGLETC